MAVRHLCMNLMHNRIKVNGLRRHKSSHTDEENMNHRSFPGAGSRARISLFRALIAGFFFLGRPAAAAAQANSVPPLSHVIVIMMENQAYVNMKTLPYISTLISAYSSFADSYAITHPSQPNYLAIWSGSTQKITDDTCPAPGSPFSTPNLGQACEAAGLTWRAYCEGLPSDGYTGCSADGGLYMRKHAPWTDFGNLNHNNERPYSDLATDLANGTLPNLAFVIPNMCDDMHDCAPSVGDTWLSKNVPSMLAGLGPNGLLVLTWDEDDDAHGNNILTVFAGPLVRSGYISTTVINHYTVLRTIGDGLSLAPIGLASGQNPILDVWRGISGAGTIPATRAWLGAVTPNPSGGSFAALLSLPLGRQVEAAIFDAGGREVVPAIREPGPSGSVLRWDGRGTDGRRVPGGLYFLRVRVGTESEERKLILLGEAR